MAPLWMEEMQVGLITRVGAYIFRHSLLEDVHTVGLVCSHEKQVV